MTTYAIRCNHCLPIESDLDGGIVLDGIETHEGARQAAQDHDVATHGAKVNPDGTQRTNFTAIIEHVRD